MNVPTATRNEYFNVRKAENGFVVSVGGFEGGEENKQWFEKTYIANDFNAAIDFLKEAA